MKTEYFPVITPDEGMVLYNEGKNVYSEKAYIGRLDSVDNWREVPRAQYDEFLAEQERQAEQMAKEAETAND